MDRQGTSGVLVEDKPNGGLRIGYVDYGTEFFGGRDYESFYNFDKENADKLRAYFTEHGYKNLQEGLESIVGKQFDDKKFTDLCKSIGAKYEHISWF